MKTLSRSLGAFSLLPVAVAVCLCGLAIPAACAAEAPNPATGAQGFSVQPGPPPPLTILFTGEVTGWTEPCG